MLAAGRRTERTADRCIHPHTHTHTDSTYHHTLSTPASYGTVLSVGQLSGLQPRPSEHSCGIRDVRLMSLLPSVLPERAAAMRCIGDRRRSCHQPMLILSWLPLLLLCVVMSPVTAQPHSSIVSYPIPATAVPVPGTLNAADAPSPPVTVVSASSNAATSSSATATAIDITSTTSCTTNWCTKDGQWLPVNVTSPHIQHSATQHSSSEREDDSAN